MKKSVLAVAVLATMSAQADTTTLYGKVEGTYNLVDGKGSAVSEFQTDGSWGIKGDNDLGNGLSAIYKYEQKINSNKAAGTVTIGGKKYTVLNDNAQTDNAYVGLKGSFGQITIGDQALPVDNVGAYDAPLENLDVGQNGVNDSTTSGIVYYSPEMNGLQFGLGLEANGKAGERHVDHANLAITYSANGFKAGLGYDRDVNAKTNGTVVAFGYGNDVIEAGVEATFTKPAGKGTKSVTSARLGLAYNATANDSIVFGLGAKDVSEFSDEYEVALGYHHAFSKRTSSWVEYKYQEADSANIFQVGMKTKF